MKKFISFIRKLFTPKFRIKFITPNGIIVSVTCTYGSEEKFKEMVTNIFPFIELEHIIVKKNESAEEKENISTGAYYE